MGKVYREEEYSKRFGERTRRSRGGAPSTPKSPPLQKTIAAPPPRGVCPARTSRQRPALRRKTITGVTPRKPAKRNRPQSQSVTPGPRPKKSNLELVKNQELAKTEELPLAGYLLLVNTLKLKNHRKLSVQNRSAKKIKNSFF